MSLCQVRYHIHRVQELGCGCLSRAIILPTTLILRNYLHLASRTSLFPCFSPIEVVSASFTGSSSSSQLLNAQGAQGSVLRPLYSLSSNLSQATCPPYVLGLLSPIPISLLSSRFEDYQDTCLTSPFLAHRCLKPNISQTEL